MTAQEIGDIMQVASKLNINEMSFKDQMSFYLAIGEFAEKVKPLTIKYMNQDTVSGTFLFKMGD